MAILCYIVYSSGFTFQGTLYLFHRMYTGPLSTMVEEMKFEVSSDQTYCHLSQLIQHLVRGDYTKTPYQEVSKIKESTKFGNVKVRVLMQFPTSYVQFLLVDIPATFML
jgi:hypothetical protein